MRTFCKRLFSGWILSELFAIGLSVHYWIFTFPGLTAQEDWGREIGLMGWFIMLLESLVLTWAVGFLLAAFCYLRYGHFGLGYRELELVSKDLSDAA